MESRLSLDSVKNTFQTFNKKIWRIRADELPAYKSLWIRTVRIVSLSVAGFEKHNCMHRASALTFYSLLSIVPVLAMAFGLAKGFGFEKALEGQLLNRFQGQEEIIQRATEFAHSLLANTKGGLMAGIGVLLLFWTIIRMLGNIEIAFNHIWGIERQRGIGRRISDYLSAMLVCPILFIVSSTATVMIASQVRLVVEKISLLGPIGPAIFFVLQWLPFAVMWILFTFVYLFMPNGKIQFKSGLFAGIVGGTLYQIFQAVYVSFQIGVAKYNAIYGSFAALPLFLIWLQVSWMIVLFGAEISCAHQTEKTYEFEPDCTALSHSALRLVTLRIVHLLVNEFAQGLRPLSAAHISAKLGIPIRLVWRLLNGLVMAGLLSEICEDGAQAPAYQPAQDVNLFTIQFVTNSLESHGTANIPMENTPEMEKIAQCLSSFDDAIQKSPANLLLKDI